MRGREKKKSLVILSFFPHTRLFFEKVQRHLVLVSSFPWAVGGCSKPKSRRALWRHVVVAHESRAPLSGSRVWCTTREHATASAAEDLKRKSVLRLMFQVARLEDASVKILPENLGKPRLEAITQEIESLYIDKVIKDLGLVVTLYEIISIEGGTLYPGEGSAHFHVVFRVVVFRPFVGEVLEGKLKKADKTGIYVSIGFFSDIFIPEHLLQEPSVFDEAEQLWVWMYQGEQKMFMDLEEPIRVRVQSVRFPDQPRSANEMVGVGALGGATPDGTFAPLVVLADVNADGLGLLSWWQQ